MTTLEQVEYRLAMAEHFAKHGGPAESKAARARVAGYKRLRALLTRQPARVCRGCAEGCEGCGYAVLSGAHVGQGA